MTWNARKAGMERHDIVAIHGQVRRFLQMSALGSWLGLSMSACVLHRAPGVSADRLQAVSFPRRLGPLLHICLRRSTTSWSAVRPCWMHEFTMTLYFAATTV